MENTTKTLEIKKEIASTLILIHTARNQQQQIMLP